MNENDKESIEISEAALPLFNEQFEEQENDQSWYWTEEWQRGEREADEDLKMGRSRIFYSTEEFLSYLENPDDLDE